MSRGGNKMSDIDEILNGKISFVLLFLISMITIGGCSKSNPKAALELFSGQNGIDLTQGEILRQEDTHGGFHGDGYTLISVQYADNSIADELEESGQWHTLPLPEALDTFIYQPYDTKLDIPVISNGYYFFVDRHTEATDPSDPTELLNRASFNFTFAAYDKDSDILYLCIYDT